MAAGQVGKQFRWLTDTIGHLSLAASRHAKITLLLILVITVVLGYGTTKLTTNVDVADVLPRGNYNTTAAQKLTTDFKSAFTMQVTLQFHVDETGQKWAEDSREKLPNRQSEARPENITDEVYVRAMAQAVAFIKDHDPLVCCVIGVEELYKLINWTLAGGADGPHSAWGLPATDAAGSRAYDTVDRAATAAILSAIDALSSPEWTGSAVLFMPAADETADTGEIGRRAIAARDAYVEWAEANPDEAYQVFTGPNRPLLTVEIPVANAHSSELVREDFSKLLPIICVFILVALFIAFRSVGAVLISFSSLALGTIWTYGAEGYLGIALNPLNLTLMPLIMGVGIDYGIHVVNEFIEHKSHGLSDMRAFQEVGRRGGLALFVATLTTVGGLLVMVVSPSVLIAEFGALAALAMVAIFILSLTFIPAALTLYPGTDKMGASFKPSTMMLAVSRLVGRARWIVLVVVLVASTIGYAASLSITNEAFGDPGRNYLRSDPVREEHERGLQWFYNVQIPDIKANVLTFEGDLTDPQAHRYIRSIEAELKKQPRVISDTLRTIPFLMETWLTVRDGGPGAVSYLAQGRAGAPPYPATADEIKREFDALYASPVRELGSIFTNGPGGGYNLGVMTFSVRAATYAEAEEVWNQVWGAVGNASADKPQDMKVAFVGNTATNYLFVSEEVPWVLYMSLIATSILLVVSIFFFRHPWPVVGIMLVSFATSAIWLGLLPSLDVGMAITLVIPLVFIIALGSDYAVHMTWSIFKTQDPAEVYRTTGKAIFFSWLTTVGPFIIFFGIQDLSVRKTMIATSLAITIIFVITLLVIPSFYPPGRRVKRPPEHVPAEADPLSMTATVEAPKRPKAVAVPAAHRPKTGDS